MRECIQPSRQKQRTTTPTDLPATLVFRVAGAGGSLARIRITQERRRRYLGFPLVFIVIPEFDRRISTKQIARTTYDRTTDGTSSSRPLFRDVVLFGKVWTKSRGLQPGQTSPGSPRHAIKQFSPVPRNGQWLSITRFNQSVSVTSYGGRLFA